MGKTEADNTVTTVVPICAGRAFIAGTDVREFGEPPITPPLLDLLMQIEQSSKSLVEAIHGSDLCGGLETAMTRNSSCGNRLI